MHNLKMSLVVRCNFLIQILTTVGEYFVYSFVLLKIFAKFRALFCIKAYGKQIIFSAEKSVPC
jgi:hypothetical protein